MEENVINKDKLDNAEDSDNIVTSENSKQPEEESKNSEELVDIEISDNEETNETSENNKFQIVAGDGSEIEISPVREYLNAMKPKTQGEKGKKQIVIPKVKKDDLND